MNAREERGIIIAALTKLNRKGAEWLVPSQSDAEKNYRVDPFKQTCTCPDHKETGFKCKHQFAVEFTIKREIGSDGSVEEMRQLTFTEKVTYTQDWPAYNKAQAREKNRIQELLFDLCRDIPEPVITGKGQRPHSMKDSIFAMVFKVYCGFSARRVSCDFADAHARGHLSKLIPGMKVNKFMENAEFTEILKVLIACSAAPLKSVEADFAIDSSGFSACRFDRWYDEKYGEMKKEHGWVKVHLACGVKTNIVTAVRILDKDAADAPQFVPLVKETARRFEIGEVSADKAYTSLENFEAVAGFGGTAFMAFKSNTTGTKGGLFQKMFHYFQFNKEDYMTRYHKRSNVESTFSMIKRKFGDSVKSKSEVASVNEVLCKILAHNLCVLNQEECELGIEAVFSKSATTQVKMMSA